MNVHIHIYVHTYMFSLFPSLHSCAHTFATKEAGTLWKQIQYCLFLMHPQSKPTNACLVWHIILLRTWELCFVTISGEMSHETRLSENGSCCTGTTTVILARWSWWRSASQLCTARALIAVNLPPWMPKHVMWRNCTLLAALRWAFADRCWLCSGFLWSPHPHHQVLLSLE